jgi:hypothetical protein
MAMTTAVTTPLRNLDSGNGAPRMNAFLRSASIAVAAIAFVGLAEGQSPRTSSRSDVPEAGVELTAGSIAFPNSTNGTLVMKVCKKCPLKSYPVTNDTTYYLYSSAVTLQQLTTALAGLPKAYVGVTYSPKPAKS